jgi:hypothetical protein
MVPRMPVEGEAALALGEVCFRARLARPEVGHAGVSPRIPIPARARRPRHHVHANNRAMYPRSRYM